ncbi:MAG TPA: PTS sugar transporter subunit IIA [Candidatus Cloacimonadota bacterium]|nr:PTS sugar transporter subunit IIA [Candidatus Cloacimonadota bacterium]
MEVFKRELIYLQEDIISKGHCIATMAEYLYENDKIEDLNVFLEAVFEREEIMSTGIGRGIAIPHGRSSVVKELSCVLMTLKNEIDFDSIDGVPVKIVFMLCIPEDIHSEYTQLLSKISKYMHDEYLKNALLSSDSVDEVYQLIKGIENEF